ncbi:MAG: 2-C-methyl-D-erythritol 4-phosphate cytidylyltransferase [Candidatus Thiodiazotropha sp. L084R]
MSSRCWAVVPAAGVGRRMGGDIPKQYLDLSGRRIIDHALASLLSHPRISAVYVALSEEDDYWELCDYASDPRVIRVTGGKERYHSVFNALKSLLEQANEDDWVLVHDAARPCLTKADLTRLIESLHDHPVGGLLGVPVSDTLKRVDSAKGIDATISREGLWRAYTPQMFRLGLLISSIEAALLSGVTITDEAGAMELSGYQPQMVEGEATNIKITRPDDLKLARLYLQTDR